MMGNMSLLDLVKVAAACAGAIGLLYAAMIGVCYLIGKAKGVL